MAKGVHEALIHPTVSLGEDVEIGYGAIIEKNVTIGNGTKIGAYSYIAENTIIGEDNQIYPYVVIGFAPQDVNYGDEPTRVRIGNRNIIREFVTIHRATGAGNETIIGDDNFIMAYVHIAHNCRLGNGIVIANASQLAGYVEVQDHAFISGLCPIHQFVRIGAYAMVAGGYRVPKDVPPYALVAGEPLRVVDVNRVGLRRHNFAPHEIDRLHKAFRLLFSSKYNLQQAIAMVQKELQMDHHVEYLIKFILESKRGVVR